MRTVVIIFFDPESDGLPGVVAALIPTTREYADASSFGTGSK
jgi:hypothetical protein